MASDSDFDLTSVGAAIGDRSRAAMLIALLGGTELTSSELARAAQVSNSTASEHLGKLVAANLVVVHVAGRNRLHSLAGPLVADALERLGSIAPPQEIHSLKQARIGDALRRARSCYDHLAGELAIDLIDGLEKNGALLSSHGTFELTGAGEDQLAAIGLHLDALRHGRRAFARRCLDWSERRDHLAGALGAALMRRFLELQWLQRTQYSRALQVTATGDAGFAQHFGITRA
ncbi:MAG: winged helix-turn-helix domain-containing protein [Pseudolysinimonas sp.]